MNRTRLFPHSVWVLCLLSIATFVHTTVLSNVTLADPTLVVDLDTGSMDIHVGDTSGISPITKTIIGCSWGGVGACSLSITPGDWLSFTGFQLTSPGNSFNSDGNPVSTPGDIPGMSVLGNTTGGYAEGNLFASSQLEPLVISLSKTYNTSLNAQDIMFSSVMGVNTTPWNTIYISGVPEPSSAVLTVLGVLALGTRRRRNR